MKKKMIIALIVVVLLVPSFVFASLFDISLGATAQFGKNPIDTEFDWGSLGKIDNWSFGGEARFKLTIIEIDVVGLYNNTNGDNVISGLATAGLVFDIANVVRLGVGMGPQLSYNITKNEFFMGSSGALSSGNFVDTFMNSPMNYRATLDFLFGKHFMVGLNYQVPSSFTFAGLNPKELMPLWDLGRYGVSVLFSFF